MTLLSLMLSTIPEWRISLFISFVNSALQLQRYNNPVNLQAKMQNILEKYP